MLKIYLARHGQDHDNVKGILNGRRDKQLTALGEIQAQRLGVMIKDKGIKFDKVYCSPLKRAHKTADIVSKILNLDKPEVMDELIERDFGIMTGKSHSEIEKYCAPNIIKAEKLTYFLSPDGAETFPDLIIRGNIVLDKIKKSHDNGNILLVSHGDIGKMIYATYYGLNWKEFLPKFHFGNSDLLLMSEDTLPTEAQIITVEQKNL